MLVNETEATQLNQLKSLDTSFMHIECDNHMWTNTFTLIESSTILYLTFRRRPQQRREHHSTKTVDACPCSDMFGDLHCVTANDHLENTCARKFAKALILRSVKLISFRSACLLAHSHWSPVPTALDSKTQNCSWLHREKTKTREEQPFRHNLSVNAIRIFTCPPVAFQRKRHILLYVDGPPSC